MGNKIYFFGFCSHVTIEASSITCNIVVINPDMHGDPCNLNQALWRLNRNEADGGRGRVLISAARQVSKMRENEPIELASPVDGLEWHNIIAVIVISNSRREIEVVFTHVANCQIMGTFFKLGK